MPVDKDEAKSVLQMHLDMRKNLSYTELADRIKKQTVEVIEVTGPSGSKYCLEIEARWDAQPGGAIRVLACIDDGGTSSLIPISADFIVNPDGSISG